MKHFAHISGIIEQKGGRTLALDADGGAFALGPLRIIAANGGGWDHVSVSLKNRTPRYDEMKMVKRIFFNPNEWAIEYHAPTSEHINIHDNVLHLWRPQGQPLPVPPKEMV